MRSDLPSLHRSQAPASNGKSLLLSWKDFIYILLLGTLIYSNVKSTWKIQPLLITHKPNNDRNLQEGGVQESALAIKGSDSENALDKKDNDKKENDSSTTHTAVIATEIGNVADQHGEPTKNGWVTIQVFAGNNDILLDARPASKNQWHSQVGQDAIVAGLMRNKPNGYFIDLAANDAVELSNTLGLEQHLNWTGKWTLCVLKISTTNNYYRMM
jgi:hypothetical protein